MKKSSKNNTVIRKSRSKTSPASGPSDWQPAPLLGRLPVEEIYIDGFQGMMFRDGVVKLNLYSEQYTEESKNTMGRYLRAYLCMSLPTLLSMHNALSEIMEDMKKRGILQ